MFRAEPERTRAPELLKMKVSPSVHVSGGKKGFSVVLKVHTGCRGTLMAESSFHRGAAP